MSKVSLIICCYNGSLFIDHCFSCVLAQTYKNVEIVFVNDGSTDNSYQDAFSYTDRFIEEGMSLMCLTQENKGAGGAAALALLHATGDYICCYDIDDTLFPEAIERMTTFLDTHTDYALVRTNGYMINPQTGNRELFVKDKIEKERTEIFEDILFGRTNNWAGSYMVRSSTLWQIYPNHHIIESRYGQNLQLVMAVAYKNKAGFVDEPMMEYDYNPNSFTNRNKDYDTLRNNYLGFKTIRLLILEKLGADDKNILKELDTYYTKVLMDLSLNFVREEDYINLYEFLRQNEKPSPLYSYYYYRIKGCLLKQFYFRLLSFSQSLLK